MVGLADSNRRHCYHDPTWISLCYRKHSTIYCFILQSTYLRNFQHPTYILCGECLLRANWIVFRAEFPLATNPANHWNFSGDRCLISGDDFYEILALLCLVCDWILFDPGHVLFGSDTSGLALVQQSEARSRLWHYHRWLWDECSYA